VICLDLGGISSQVDAATGFRLPVGNRDTTIRQIAKALSELAENSELKRSLGQAGQARVKASFDWNDKGTQLARRYREVTSVTRPKPDPAVYGAYLTLP
jgi:glycosyltransferase involved in cell wall biosynthesis